MCRRAFRPSARSRRLLWFFSGRDHNEKFESGNLIAVDGDHDGFLDNFQWNHGILNFHHWFSRGAPGPAAWHGAADRPGCAAAGASAGEGGATAGARGHRAAEEVLAAELRPDQGRGPRSAVRALLLIGTVLLKLPGTIQGSSSYGIFAWANLALLVYV